MELLVLQEFRVAVHSLTNLKCQKAVKNRRDLIFFIQANVGNFGWSDGLCNRGESAILEKGGLCFSSARGISSLSGSPYFPEEKQQRVNANGIVVLSKTIKKYR